MVRAIDEKSGKSMGNFQLTRSNAAHHRMLKCQSSRDAIRALSNAIIKSGLSWTQFNTSADGGNGYDMSGGSIIEFQYES